MRLDSKESAEKMTTLIAELTSLYRDWVIKEANLAVLRESLKDQEKLVNQAQIDWMSKRAEFDDTISLEQ